MYANYEHTKDLLHSCQSFDKLLCIPAKNKQRAYFMLVRVETNYYAFQLRTNKRLTLFLSEL